MQYYYSIDRSIENGLTKPTYINLLSVFAGNCVPNGLTKPTHIVLVSVFPG